MFMNERGVNIRDHLRWIFLAGMLMVIISSSAAEAAKLGKPAGGSLIGAWQCTGNFGSAELVFESQHKLVFDSEEAIYQVVPGAIRVQDEEGPVDYMYTLKGRNLSVTLPDGTTMQCVKGNGGISKHGGESNEPTGTSAGKGSNWQLRGMLCSWSGSSSSSSGYSRTTRVAFDGQGGFRYGSESSFSSGAGQAYGLGGGNHGTYRVSGNKVYLTFSDGGSGVAQVHMKQNSGMITELMYEGTLYASGLCD
jgi:hypothetical protein